MELNPELDLDVNIHDLTQEFKQLSLKLYRYSCQRAKMDSIRDIAKAKHKEARAIAFKRAKSDTSVKHTEKSIEAELDLDSDVKKALIELIKAEHDASSWSGAVESMKAKKDMLIQLGSDRRKEA